MPDPDKDSSVVNTHKVWSPLPERYSMESPKETELFCINESLYRDKFSVVYSEMGKDRMPQNKYDMNLYASKEDTVSLLDEWGGNIQRIDVPHVEGAFVLTNVLHLSECKQIISAAETMGFCPDEPIGGSAADLNSILAHNFFWLADRSLVESIYQRCKHLLPQFITTDSNQKVEVYLLVLFKVDDEQSI